MPSFIKTDAHVNTVLPLTNRTKKRILILLCGYGGIGRRAGFRVQCPRRAGSSPVSRTMTNVLTAFSCQRTFVIFYLLNSDITGGVVHNYACSCIHRYILLAFSSILCYNYFYKFFQYTMEANYEIHRIAQPPYRDKLPCLWRIMEPRRY